MEELIDKKPDGTIVQIELNGSWENKGRNITATALTGLAGIGVIYFNAQSIIAVILILIYKNTYHTKLAGNIVENINIIMNELKTPLLIALTVSQFLFMLFPTLWLVKKWHARDVIKYLRVRSCPFKEIALAVLITIFLLPFCYYLSYLIEQVFRLPEVYKNIGPQLFTAGSNYEFIMMIFVVAVTPAICEEILFRGYFQRTLERTIGAKSFIVTGIIFGLFHMQPLSLITLSILGILFSFFYYRSKSIFPSSAAHFTNNFIAVLLLYFQTKSINLTAPLEGKFSAIWIILSTLIAVGFILTYFRITKKTEVDNYQTVS